MSSIRSLILCPEMLEYWSYVFKQMKLNFRNVLHTYVLKARAYEPAGIQPPAQGVTKAQLKIFYIENF